MKRPWLWVLILLLAGVGIYGIADLTAHHSTTPPIPATGNRLPPKSHTGSATTHKKPAPQAHSAGPADFYAVIPAYYGYVNAGNYRSAYRLFVPSWQKSHPYAAFAAGYAATKQVTASQTVQAVGNFNAVVDVTLTALQKTGQVQHFSGTVSLQDLSQGAGPATWRIASAQFSAVPG